MVSVMPSKPPLLYPSQSRLLRELGQRLRDARLRRRFAVSLVAERAEVSRPTLNKVEQGSPAVTMGTYLRVMGALGVAVAAAGVGTGADAASDVATCAASSSMAVAPATRAGKASGLGPVAAPDEVLA